jgi:hypothetical protein
MDVEAEESFYQPAAKDVQFDEQDRCPLSAEELLRLVAEMVD